MGSETSKNLKKVEIEIYFWYGGNGNVGHVSLYIPETYLYISYWPENTTRGLESVPSATNTYAEDVSAQEREADYVLKASVNLDLNAMEKFWKDDQKQNYSFIGNNCSDAVMKALQAGNIDFSKKKIYLRSTIEPNSNWSHDDYVAWIQAKFSEFRLWSIGNALRKNK